MIQNTSMKILLLLPLAAIVGCASFTTTQTDVSYEKDSKSPTRTITTRVKVATFFDSSSQLAQSKATQTDKTQSASLGSLNQTATSSNIVTLSGNAVDLIKLLHP